MGEARKRHARRRMATALTAVMVALAAPANARADRLPAADRYGVNLTLGYRGPGAPRALELARDAGAGWAHLTFFWAVVEPRPGDFDWSAFDPLVERANRAGLRAVGQLAYSTQWNTTAPPTVVQRGEREHYPPSDYDAWANYVRETVSRYKGTVRHWEVWNEPDHEGFWHGTPAEYARLLAVTYGAVKSVDPQAEVLMGGLSLGGSPGMVDDDFLRDILRDPDHPAGRYFDIANYHQYGAPDEVWRRIEYVRAELRQAGLRRPVWVTEVGYGSNPDHQPLDGYRGEDAQPRWLEETLPRLLEQGAEKVFWFRLMDAPAERGRYGYYGLLDASLERKPSYFSYSEVIRENLAVTIVSTRIRASSRGRVRVRLSCAADSAVDRCRGRLTLSHRGRRIARGNYAIRAGDSDYADLTLSRYALHRVRKHRNLRAEAIADASGCAAGECSAKRSLRLRSG